MSWLVDSPDLSSHSIGPTPAISTPMNSSNWTVGRPYRISGRRRSAVEMMPRSCASAVRRLLRLAGAASSGAVATCSVIGRLVMSCSNAG